MASNAPSQTTTMELKLPARAVGWTAGALRGVGRLW
jgi:hypothetical protein